MVMRSKWMSPCQVWRRSLLAACTVLLTLMAAPSAAQTLGAGSIQGLVTDESGAPMPGVTITATSPALLVPQVVVVSAADGAYRFATLPVGVYAIEFELAGFQRFSRRDLRLNAGFVATVNVVMVIGALEESVTVVGASPVVDIRTTTTQTNVTKEALEDIPVGRTWNSILGMAAGVRVNNPDVAGSTTGDAPNYSAYGVSGQNTPMIEGLNTREGANSACFYYDYSAFEEVQIKALGAGADVGTPGVVFQGIVKSGGNEFHGRYFFAGHTDKLPLQSDNVTDALKAKGVTGGNSMIWYYDVSGDLGGRLIRNKLWFYGAVLRQQSKATLIGYSKAPGPDGRYGTADDEEGFNTNLVPNETLKLTYQLAPKHKLIGFFQHNKRATFERGGSRFVPYERTYNYDFAPTAAKGEWQSTLTDSLLVNAQGGYVWYWTNFAAQEGINRAGNPSRRDIATGMQLGPPARIYRSFRRHWQASGSATYFANSARFGQHELKAGYDLHWEHRADGIEGDRPSGNYELVFDNGRPIQIVFANLPVDSSGSKMDNFAAFIQDSWTIGRRLTLNLGLRAERYKNWVDPVTKAQGQFGDAGQFPRVDILTWDSLMPRVGLVFDLTGDARTVVKATWGVFGWNPAVDFSAGYNRGTRTTYTYRWTDPNGNGDYDAGEVNLDRNGPAFLSQAGATTIQLNPDLKQPTTVEASLALERELIANLGVRVAFVRKDVKNTISNINTLRPYSAWTIPLNVRDPGPDGIVGTADDGGSLTIYDYAPAFRGAAFVNTVPTNAPDGRADRYDTYEVTVVKRRSGGWDGSASLAVTKNERWVSAIITNPNQEIYPLDETWNWSFKLGGTYAAPWGVNLGAFWTGLSGTQQQRTFIFRGLPQTGTLTLPMEKLGAQALPDLHSVNLRLGKSFRIGQYRLDFNADLFNAFNVSTVRAQTFASGPTYGAITSIFSPRIVRIGTTLSF